MMVQLKLELSKAAAEAEHQAPTLKLIQKLEVEQKLQLKLQVKLKL
jgi:hypothetical protein